MRNYWGVLSVMLSSCIATNVLAVYGKVSGGMSYTVAKKMDHNSEAYEKALEADSFAEKISNLNPRVLNALPDGMILEEFVYELLNWHGNKKAIIDEELKLKVMQVSKSDETAGEIVGEIGVKFTIAKRLFLEAKIIDQRITQKAISETLETFAQLDTEAKELLGRLWTDIANGSIDGKIEGYITQFQQIYEKSSIDFDAILSQKYAEIPGSVRLAEPNSKTHVAARESITSKRAVLNALLEYIKSLGDSKKLETAVIETQTNPVAVAMSEMGTQAVPQIADQSTQTDLTGQDINQLQRNLVAKQAEIAQLRREVDNRKEAAERIDRERLFEKYLLGLLTRALTGVDYTKPDESDPEIYRNTVLSTAKGSGAKPHNREIKGRFSNDGLRIDHWKQANECIRSCICSIMAGLNQNLESIKSDINKACEQLPTSKLDDETVRIGLTLQKILETVTVYEVDDRSLPPIDDVDQKVKEEVQRRGKE